MKKYRLSFCETASVEYTEDEFKKLENIIIKLQSGQKTQGKVCYVRADNLKHEMLMYVPVENFEVRDDRQD